MLLKFGIRMWLGCSESHSGDREIKNNCNRKCSKNRQAERTAISHRPVLEWGIIFVVVVVIVMNL
jgi:uncharacterized membrane protein YvbJ